MLDPIFFIERERDLFGHYAAGCVNWMDVTRIYIGVKMFSCFVYIAAGS